MRKSIFIMKSLMVVIALSVVSCNTDDDIKCPDALIGELSATEAEFSGSWKFAGMEADEALDLTDDNTDNPSTDIFAQYSSCERDLEYNFMSDRKYELKQGYSAVDCNNKLALDGTWNLTGDDLTFVANCASQRITIEQSEDGNEFSYESLLNFRDVNGLEKSVKVTFTYEKVAGESEPQ